MAVLALVFWSCTALAGLYLLAIWLIEHDPGFRHAVPTRLPALVITGHVLFAVVGLVSWVTYLITANGAYYWTSAGTLAAIATLGFTMLFRWIEVYRAWQRGSAPADSMPYGYGAYTLAAWARMRDWQTRTPGLPSDRVRPWELAVPPERNFPVSLVIAHGILAVTTVVLVVLTVVHQVTGLGFLLWPTRSRQRSEGRSCPADSCRRRQVRSVQLCPVYRRGLVLVPGETQTLCTPADGVAMMCLRWGIGHGHWAAGRIPEIA